MILDLARENIEQRARMGFVQGDPAAIMIVEYSGESEAEVRAKIEALEALRARSGSATPRTSPTTRRSSSPWRLRKAGLGLLLGTKGDRKPIAFVEDTAVEPAKLGPFINRFREILTRGARARALRPLLGGVPPHPPADQPEGRGRDREDARDRREITALVVEFGGGLSGEHGDGREAPSTRRSTAPGSTTPSARSSARSTRRGS